MDPLPVEEVIKTELLIRGATTAGIVVFVVLVLVALKATIVRFVRVRQMHRLRGRFVYRMARVFTVIFASFVLAYVWGFDPEKLWVVVTGFLGLVAIGFFAVWSLLSNTIAGLFLFLSDPFKINDEKADDTEPLEMTCVDAESGIGELVLPDVAEAPGVFGQFTVTPGGG